MASTFFLPANPTAPAPTSAFNTRPRSSTTKTLLAPRTYSQQVPRIAEPQHNDQYIEGDAPFLSDHEVDLDVSFASNMSLSSAPNSPPAHATELPIGSQLLMPHQRLAPSSPVPMDISPAPRRIASTVRAPSSRDTARDTKGLSGRALVLELLRGFGQDVSNTSNSSTSTLVATPRGQDNTRHSPMHPKERATATVSTSSARSRTALPAGWMQPSLDTITSPVSPQSTGSVDAPRMVRNRSQTLTFPHVSEEAHPPAASVAWDNSISCDAMDIDGEVSISHSVTAPSSPSTPAAAAEFNELFFQPSSPPVLASSSPDANKRRSSEPEPEHDEFVEFDLEEEIAHARQLEQNLAEQAELSPEKPALFSSSPPVSPSRPIRPAPGIGLGRPFERSATTGGQGTLFPTQGQAILPKRGNIMPRRPALSAANGQSVPASAGLPPRPGGLQPTRRAFSACVTSSALVMGSPVMDVPGSDDSHCDLDGSPARAYATRKAAAPQLRRLGVVPSKGAVETQQAGSQGNAPKHGSPLVRAGLPGFGDNEADGKVLPCHRVREDGLMRITPDTLDTLLAGQYDSQINSFTVIDCRFEYEYEGGHVPGAINLNTTQAIEDYLLGDNKPAPSRSGDGTKKDVLVFHCEFSVKRAPTFAKHLRSRDRALNSHSYPNIHYPEVYIMDGGFSQYFKEKPSQVEPPYSYVQMDDPVHLRARHSDLNNFRRWERTKSYTYGEKQAAAAAIASGQAQAKRASGSANAEQANGNSKRSGSSSQSQNNTLGRRMGNGPAQAGSLSTLDEDGDSMYDVENDLSPCPPSSAANYLRLAGKSRMIGRGGLDRAASFGFATTKR